jgi:hypothetical protein
MARAGLGSRRGRRLQFKAVMHDNEHDDESDQELYGQGTC